MDATDRTIEEVLIQLLEKGEGVRLIVVGLIALSLGVLAGWFFTKLYFQKFKYVKMENDVHNAQKKLAEAEEKVTKIETDYNELEQKYEKIKVFEDKYYVSLATKPDTLDCALTKIFEE